MSSRKRFAQSFPRTHISTVAKIIEPPMEGPFGGNVTFHPRRGHSQVVGRFALANGSSYGDALNLAVKDQFWEGPIFHSGAIRVGDANVLANGSAGASRIYRAVVFPGARATREVWAALVRDGRCSRVARGGKNQGLPRGRQERQSFSHGC